MKEELQQCCVFEDKTRKICCLLVWESQWCTVGLQVKPFHAISLLKKGSPLKRPLNRCAFDVMQKKKKYSNVDFFSFLKINQQWALTFNKLACSIPGHRTPWEKLQTANTIAG